MLIDSSREIIAIRRMACAEALSAKISVAKSRAGEIPELPAHEDPRATITNVTTRTTTYCFITNRNNSSYNKRETNNIKHVVSL